MTVFLMLKLRRPDPLARYSAQQGIYYRETVLTSRKRKTRSSNIMHGDIKVEDRIMEDKETWYQRSGFCCEIITSYLVLSNSSEKDLGMVNEVWM